MLDKGISVGRVSPSDTLVILCDINIVMWSTLNSGWVTLVSRRFRKFQRIYPKSSENFLRLLFRQFTSLIPMTPMRSAANFHTLAHYALPIRGSGKSFITCRYFWLPGRYLGLD